MNHDQQIMKHDLFFWLLRTFPTTAAAARNTSLRQLRKLCADNGTPHTAKLAGVFSGKNLLVK